MALVAVARGWQASVATLGTLRQVVHALRGWPTPLGLAINSTVTTFDESGRTDDASTAAAVERDGRSADRLCRRWAPPGSDAE